MKATRWAIGSDPECELVLDHPSVARRHAWLERDDAGHLWLEAEPGAPALGLWRNGQWVEAERLTLCAGDRLRIGERDLPLTELTARAGPGVTLRAVRLPSPGPQGKAGGPLRRPVRDPRTGLVDEGGD